MPPCLQMPVPERLAELRDVDMDAVEGARRRFFVPERVDQAVRRDDLAGVQEKHREQRSLLAGTDLERLFALTDLEWAENSELHRVRPAGHETSFSAHLKRGTSGAQGLLKRAAPESRCGRSRRGRGVSVATGLRWLVVVTLLLYVAPSSSHAETPPPDPSRERSSTVVVSVRDDGFHWADAGVGAAAMLATSLLVVGLVLVLRPDRVANGNR